MTEPEAMKAIEEGRFRLVVFHLSGNRQPGFVIFETDSYTVRKSAERFGATRYYKHGIQKIQLLQSGKGDVAALRRFKEGAIIPAQKKKRGDGKNGDIGF